ncbi:MAG: acetylxylan esterase [Planctomycetota bacterium]|nr:acetylxylan esterase [Planctomycetota bacterium]
MLSLPEDYGLDEEQTLAFTVDDDPPAGFEAFWSAFREEIAALPSTWRGTVDGSLGQLMIESVRGVRVIARLSMPTPKPRAVVITTHGPPDRPAEWSPERLLLTALTGEPDVFPAAPEPWSEAGLATLRLAVRGYPPSTMDIDDLRPDWILTKLGLADSWVVRGAAADVVQAYRCARRYFGPAMPIGLHGESLGGGLVVIAAAQLAAMDDEPFRMVLAHPDLGAWRWRSEQYCGGPGGRVNERLTAMREDGPAVLETMLLYDAVFHARRLRCPTLCKLACRDDIVPAAAAAAVFNAIAGERKWRYRTACGHFDGGLEDARRHRNFTQINSRFLDPTIEPEEAIGGGDGGA